MRFKNMAEVLYLYGIPKIDYENIEGELWAQFHHFGFQCNLKYELGEYFMLVAPEEIDNGKYLDNPCPFHSDFFYNHGLQEPGCSEWTP